MNKQYRPEDKGTLWLCLWTNFIRVREGCPNLARQKFMTNNKRSYVYWWNFCTKWNRPPRSSPIPIVLHLWGPSRRQKSKEKHNNKYFLSICLLRSSWRKIRNTSDIVRVTSSVNSNPYMSGRDIIVIMEIDSKRSYCYFRKKCSEWDMWTVAPLQ